MKLARLINIESITKKILEEDELARKDDCYLILRVVQLMYPNDACKSFETVMRNAKYNGISFESITRARRKVQNKYPELKNREVSDLRNEEQVEYKQFSKEGIIK